MTTINPRGHDRDCLDAYPGACICRPAPEAPPLAQDPFVIYRERNESARWITSAPVALTREELADIIERHIDRWVQIGYDTACAGIGTLGDEPAQRKAFDQMRHLHLSEPSLPAMNAAADILAALGAPTTDEEAGR